jgi:hypothetical protein
MASDNVTKSLPQAIKQRVARDELWLARHPDEDPAIVERYRARIRELRTEELIQNTIDRSGPYSNPID